MEFSISSFPLILLSLVSVAIIYFSESYSMRRIVSIEASSPYFIALPSSLSSTAVLFEACGVVKLWSTLRS